MENIFGYIPRVKHIYIPDGVEMDNKAYFTLDLFSELKSISISSNHQRPNIKVRYKCEIRGEK